MRRLSPAFVLTSVVIALATTAAAAQTARNARPATTTTATTATTATAGGSTSTNNATTTTTNNATGTTVNNATGTTLNNATGTTLNNATGATLNNATGPLATGNDSTNNSSGPLSGLVKDNTTTAIAPNGSSTGTTNPNGNNPNGNNGLGSHLLVPGIITDVGALGDAGSGVNANGEPIANSGSGNAATNGAAPNTLATGNTVYTLPLYDATTKAATARELRRRDNRQEPRVIGIAPRTNNDLTNQMPDDPVIRY